MLKPRCFFLLCIVMLSFTAVQCFAQQYVLKNEQVIFSFYTAQQHKRVVIAMDKDERYLVYRFGTQKKIELEYPARDTASWKKMQFFWYLCPTGNDGNGGLDLNNISFVCNNHRYVVYQNYTSENSTSEIGVQVLDLKGNKLADFAGNPDTQKGSLINLRDYDEILARGKEEY